MLFHVFTGVVGTNAEDDCAELLQVPFLNVVRRKEGYIEAHLPQHGWDVVAGPHDVSHFQAWGDIHVHNSGTLDGWLMVEESANVGTRDQAVAFAEITTIGPHEGMDS